MRYFSRLGFILLATCLFQSHNVFALHEPEFNIEAEKKDPSDLGFELGDQDYYASFQRNQWSPTFAHPETIIFEEDIFNNDSHIISISVEGIASGNSGQLIAVNKRISNQTGANWNSILIEVSSSIVGLADPTLGAGSASANALHLGGPVYDNVSQSADDVTLDLVQNTISFGNTSSYAVDLEGYINLWFTLALPASGTSYEFDLIQRFYGPNSFGGPGPTSAVPEPGILLLVSLGLISTGIKRTKRLTREETPQMC